MNRNWIGGAAVAALVMAAAPQAFAQATVGGVAGRVISDKGQPVAGATVTVIHLPTGSRTVTTTDGQGRYEALNQRVGGPYKVFVKAQGFADETADVPLVGIGDATVADVTVYAATTVKEITITGARTNGQMGPRTRATLNDLETLPSETGDIRDYARISPYVTLEDGAMVIGGISNKMNSITIDGVKQSDNFGLNSNGYPTLHNQPVPTSVLQSLQVEVAPYDVAYGDFQGGLLNVVTKSGTNDFHGEVFGEYESQHLRGDSFYNAGALTPYTSPFKDRTWGATISGPIWQDHIFFVASYANYVGSTPFTTGVTGSGVPNPVLGVTQAGVNAVAAAAQAALGYNVGSDTVTSVPTTDRKYFAKIDWNINDQHRLVVEYQKDVGGAFSTGGSGEIGSCSASSTSNPCLQLTSHDYINNENFTAEKVQFFSHWTQAFSTELDYSRQEQDTIRAPLGGLYPDIDVYLPGTAFNANGTAICTAASPCPQVLFGTDLSTQLNVLKVQTNQFKIKGDYHLDGHTITAGWETQFVKVYNAFVQYADGAYVFDCITVATCSANGVGALDPTSGQPQAAIDKFQNTANGNVTQGASAFNYDQNTAYIQDEWAVLPTLTLRAGLRYDFYDQGSQPLSNPAFGSSFGVPNNKNLDGMHVLQPRVGFNWRPLSKTTIYGGYGLFQGGSPLVWISDSFGNPGNLLGSYTCTAANVSAVIPTPPGKCLASALLLNPASPLTPNAAAVAGTAASANLGTGVGNAIAPGTEPVSIWKATLGARRDFDLDMVGYNGFSLGKNWHAMAEIVDSHNDHALTWVDAYMQYFQSGVAPDGRPEYFGTTTSTPLFGSTSRQAGLNEIVLEDTNKGYSDVWTVSLGKDWREGLLKGLSVNLSYTNTTSKDVSSGTSSVAASNYKFAPGVNPNAQDLATSNYQIRNNLKIITEYDHKFIGDLMTRIGIYGQKRSGLPFSFLFNDALQADTALGSTAIGEGLYGYTTAYASSNELSLLYVPQVDPTTHQVTATSDPHVRFAPGFDLAGFNHYLYSTGLIKYAGQISPRNGFKAADVSEVDLYFSQEFPAFIPNHAKLEGYFDILNFGNFLNNHWGVQNEPSNNFLAPVVARNCQVGANACVANPAGNYYEYESFTAKSGNASSGSSVWQMKVGLRYKF